MGRCKRTDVQNSCQLPGEGGGVYWDSLLSTWKQLCQEKKLLPSPSQPLQNGILNRVQIWLPKQEGLGVAHSALWTENGQNICPVNSVDSFHCDSCINLFRIRKTSVRCEYFERKMNYKYPLTYYKEPGPSFLKWYLKSPLPVLILLKLH